MAKVRYKEKISKELVSMAAPLKDFKGRASLGFEGSVGEYFYIDIEKLLPYPKQARKIFKETDIDDLANSIKQYGIRQPLTIIKSVQNEGKYEIVSGERRFRAAQKLNLNKVPCIILEDTNKAEEIALIENLHREDLHPIEFGSACKKLLESSLWKTQEELSEVLSISRTIISESINYSNLPEEIKQIVLEKDIRSRSILRKLLSKKDDYQKMLEILGVSNKSTSTKKSLLRISIDEGKYIIEKSALKNLSETEKNKLVDELEILIYSLKN